MEHEKFKAWARKYGVGKLAQDLGVHRVTVSAWINGRMTPCHRHCLSILEKARRKLKLGDIVDGY